MTTTHKHMTEVCQRAFDQVGLIYDIQKIRSRRRNRQIVTMRRLAVYALIQEGYGATDIGRFIEHDHATVLHHKRTSYLLTELPQYSEQSIRDRIDHHYKEIARLEGQLKIA